MKPSQLFGVTLVSLMACAAPKPTPQVAPEPTPRAYPEHRGPRLRVAIAAFTDNEPNLPQLNAAGMNGIAPLIEEQLVTELVRTGRVTVLERKQLKKVAGEVDLGQGEMAEYFAKSEKIEKGKFLMAQAMFAGAVTEFEPDAEGMHAGVMVSGVGASASANRARVGIEMRLIDTETGKVIEATHAEGTALRVEGEVGIPYIGLQIGAGAFYKTPLGRATREAIDKAIDFILAKLGPIPWEAPIVSVESPSRVILRGGNDINLQPNDVFDVIVRSREVVDPETGDHLSWVEVPWGRIKIIEVQPELSIGEMQDGAKTPPLKAVIRWRVDSSTSTFVATTGDAPPAKANERDTTVAVVVTPAATTPPATQPPVVVTPPSGNTTPGTPPSGATPPTGPVGGKPGGGLEVPTYYEIPAVVGAPQGPVDKNGIPLALYSGEGRAAVAVGKDRLVLARPVEFDFAKATLTGAAMNLLDQIAFLLASHPELGAIQVEGHTDNVGEAKFNLRLSEARARSVANYLVARGIGEERLTGRGFGLEKPIADNKTDAGRQKNRRVEFVFKK